MKRAGCTKRTGLGGRKALGAACAGLLLVGLATPAVAGTLNVMKKTERVFGKDSTSYPNAHVSTPLCCPSRSTIFSGLYAHNHGVWFHDGTFPDQRRTVQHWLDRAGYRTALVGKFLNNWPLAKRPPSWDRYWINSGAHRGAEWSINGRKRNVGGRSTRFIARQAAREIKTGERRDRKPFFLYLAPSEPHGPLSPERKYRSKQFGAMRRTRAMTEQDLSDKPRFLREQAPTVDDLVPNPAQVRLAQLRLLQTVDDLVAKVIRKLRKAGELKDTLIVFTSDNGLLWGEHGGLVIKDLPYDASTHVPLLIRWPRSIARGKPRVDRRLVSNVDLAPTLLDVARVRRSHTPDGRSLQTRNWEREHLLLEYGGFRSSRFLIPPWIALRNDSELYVEYGPAVPANPSSEGFPPEREYYDLRADPWELESSPASAPAALSADARAAFRCRGPRACP